MQGTGQRAGHTKACRIRMQEAIAGMTALGMSPEQQRAVWRALAATLHLGCLRTPPAAAPAPAPGDAVPQPLRLAADLLGVSDEALNKVLSSCRRGTTSTTREPAAAMLQAGALQEGQGCGWRGAGRKAWGLRVES